ncbi:MAG: TetR/AcrR family transcriptional regulator [Lysobacterales bacterium]
MTKRAILDAAKTLLWEQGFESMSPRKVMDLSGAGQGSLYHHFRSKQDLADAALAEVESELLAVAARLFASDLAPLERIRAYLLLERNGLKGCRLGRLSNEGGVLGDEVLRGRLASYFSRIEEYLVAALDQAQRDGAFRIPLESRDVAAALAASVQGGFLLSRASADPQAITRATRGAWQMLAGLSKNPSA